MRLMAKELLKLVCLLLAFPFAVPYRITRLKPIFVSNAQLLALVPDPLGSFLRIAYYRMTLQRCSADVGNIGFGSFFTQPEAEIGKGVIISAYCTIGMVRIGDYVGIGNGTDIMSGRHQHRFEDTDRPMLAQGGRFEKLTIGEDCLIFNRSLVMASLGKHNVIGAGTVVVNPTEDCVLLVGNPGRVVRRLAIR